MVPPPEPAVASGTLPAPEIWFPYEGLGPFRVLCRRPPCHPCGLHECGEFVCLPDLTVAEVAEAAGEMLAAVGRSV